ncbi:hypothetical protein FRC05_011713 [Tulasnella sp. 425]|nr:hypothetical protein FRC05_011713 [Tulasnella sp. 425]
MSSSSSHTTRPPQGQLSAPSQSTLDIDETDSAGLLRVLKSAEEPTYPHATYQPQPTCLRHSTENTLVNQDLCGGCKQRLTSQEVCQSATEEASKFSGINARTVDVTLVDNRSQTEASNGHLFFPDRRLASSPPPDGNSRPLCPRRPKDGDRYRRTRTLPTNTVLKLKRGLCPIVKEHRLPEGWEEDIHPEGQLLYSTVITIRDRHIRVYTDFALRVAENHSLIKRAVEMLSRLANECDELHNPQVKDSDIEACIVVQERAPEEFGYYLVNHRDQIIFWLEDIEHQAIRMMDLDALDSDILRLKLEALYWRHVTDFPCRCSLSSKVWEQLSPLILVGAVDQEYCDDSTAPKDAATLTRLETFWRQAKKERDNDHTRATCNWICGRLWFDFITTRVLNHWGTDYARLERTSEIQGDETLSKNAAPRVIEWLCLLFLWNEPAITMKLLDEAWPGRLVYQKPWRKMMDTFSNEWEKIFVLSAIIFAGAMAFLAIPVQNSTGSGNASPGSQPSLVTSFAFLCGVLCCVFSVASLIAAVNLKRDFGGKIVDDVAEASYYLRSLEGGVMGYLKCAIYLSLPRALFQWAVVSFSAGLVILAFQLHERQTEFFYAEVAISIVLAVGIIADREGDQKYDVQHQ